MVERKKSKDFNIYYLNFSKAYEIAMIINNVVKTAIEREKNASDTAEYGFSSGFSAKGNKLFLNGIKAHLTAEGKKTFLSSQKVVESLEVKTTKSTLLRSILERCTLISQFGETVNEGDLIKINGVKLELFDEDSLRQFLVLRRDALKGMRVEGMEVNNLISSMLQDYAYILKGTFGEQGQNSYDIMIKIPLDVKSEFESQYSIDDLLIGHVSVIGIYKGLVEESFVLSNTFSYFGEKGKTKTIADIDTTKIIKSDTPQDVPVIQPAKKETKYHFIDIIAIIQDVTFDDQMSVKNKLRWWQKLGTWLSRLGR